MKYACKFVSDHSRQPVGQRMTHSKQRTEIERPVETAELRDPENPSKTRYRKQEDRSTIVWLRSHCYHECNSGITIVAMQGLFFLSELLARFIFSLFLSNKKEKEAL